MRMPEEIKKGLEHCAIEGADCTGCVYRDECMEEYDNAPIQRDALAYIQQLEAAQPKWISVENPPKSTSDYLVYVWVSYPDGIAGMEMRTAIYNTVRKEWTVNHGRIEAIGCPSHWMPLPKPPKEG